MTRLVAGTNTARHQAYTKMISNGFRTDMLGVAMQKGMMKVIIDTMYIL